MASTMRLKLCFHWAAARSSAFSFVPAAAKSTKAASIKPLATLVPSYPTAKSAHIPPRSGNQLKSLTAFLSPTAVPTTNVTQNWKTSTLPLTNIYVTSLQELQLPQQQQHQHDVHASWQQESISTSRGTDHRSPTPLTSLQSRAGTASRGITPSQKFTNIPSRNINAESKSGMIGLMQQQRKH